jgi:signal transduction histidine kinase
MGKGGDMTAPIAEADRVRTALLAAVSHDLRTPLAAAKAAVSCLRATDIQLTAEDHDELAPDHGRSAALGTGHRERDRERAAVLPERIAAAAGRQCPRRQGHVARLRLRPRRSQGRQGPDLLGLQAAWR